MEFLQRLTDSIDYIENNLTEKVDIVKIASIACMSRFHFQRSFSMLTGVTVSEYIRKRRLTLAAQELLHSNSKVIDVALKFGYETPESFSKAFRQTHGIPPSAVRKQSQPLKAFPRISFHIQIKGDEEMQYKIVEKEAFKIIGKGIRTTETNGQNHRDIQKFWADSNQNGFVDSLARNCGELGLLGVCMEFDQEQNEFTYFIGAENVNQQVPTELIEKEIPATTWAVFPVTGPMPNAIEKAWSRIFSEWFPSTGFEHAGGMEFESYPDSRDSSLENYYTEIWIPIKKK